MLLFSSPRYRPERLIAVGRLILAVVSLVAIYFDPTEPAAYVPDDRGPA